MVYIAAVGLGIPRITLSQEDAKQLAKEVFHEQREKVKKLLPVFDATKISKRQLVADLDWYKSEKSFQDRNDLYVKETVSLSVEAITNCLNEKNIKQAIPAEAIDLIVFVSSTGISTPSIDAYIINELPLREDIVRMPLWGLGCGGGAIGISRAADWLKQNPSKLALVVCAELCSLTFQQNDFSTSNIVGTALFGDGVAATLLMGEQSNYVNSLKENKLRLEVSSSFIKKKTLQIMGWDITNNGFEVVFSKKIPRLVKTLWKEHFDTFLKELQLEVDDLHSLVAHPGGRKVLEEFEKVVYYKENLLKQSYEVLDNHGNMSSATVMYVLKKYIELYSEMKKKDSKDWAILSALGPGFCSELIALRWEQP